MSKFKTQKNKINNSNQAFFGFGVLGFGLPRKDFFRKKSLRGFTLIEMMVALSLFSVVVTVAFGALMTLIDSNKKAQGIEILMTNLNYVIDDISRNARVGTKYHCGSASGLDVPRDCGIASGSDPGHLLAFLPYNGTGRFVYWLDGGRIKKTTDGNISSGVEITAKEIVVEKFDLYVSGAPTGDNRQPRIILHVEGKINIGTKTASNFNIQTTITQRLIDF